MRPLAFTRESTRTIRGRRRRTLAALVFVLAAMARVPALGAQVLAGTVRDSASQQPIPNTRVLTLDPAGRATASVMTDQQGRFRISPWTSRAAARA
ncbi:MAG: carboxypeptidase-like regulatory domain-containing protein, partial [Gemmatimonadaceae bacterium]